MIYFEWFPVKPVILMADVLYRENGRGKAKRIFTIAKGAAEAKSKLACRAAQVLPRGAYKTHFFGIMAICHPSDWRGITLCEFKLDLSDEDKAIIRKYVAYASELREKKKLLAG